MKDAIPRRRRSHRRALLAAAAASVLIAGFAVPQVANAAEPVRVPLDTVPASDIQASFGTLRDDLPSVNGVVAANGALYTGVGSQIMRMDPKTGATTPIAGAAGQSGCADATNGAGARFGLYDNVYTWNGSFPTPIGFDGRLLYVRDDLCGIRSVDPVTGATTTLTGLPIKEHSTTPWRATVAGGTMYILDNPEDAPYKLYQRDLATGVTTVLTDKIPTLPAPGPTEPYYSDEFIGTIVADEEAVWLWGVRLYRVDRKTGEITSRQFPFNARPLATYRGNAPQHDGHITVVGDWFYFAVQDNQDFPSLARLNKNTGEEQWLVGRDAEPLGLHDDAGGWLSEITGVTSDGTRVYVAQDITSGPAIVHTVDLVRVPAAPPTTAEPEPTTEPAPEPTPVQLRDEYIALGDSYSSGFGMGDYDWATHPDTWGTDNDCQRSSLAYSRWVALDFDLHRKARACQGGVTDDFFVSRDRREGAPWGELPQLDHLSERTALVTMTIGGNDSGFSDIYLNCMIDTSCHTRDNIRKSLADAFARLDGATGTDSIHSYAQIFDETLRRAPYAQRVIVGYPAFFPSNPGTGIIDGRCEGISTSTQVWIREKTLQLNAIIKRNAESHGFRYVDPNPRFAGHEFCGGSDEWFYGVLHPGKVHPTLTGHLAIADAIKDRLSNETRPGYVVHPEETVKTTTTVPAGLQSLHADIEWPGSDIQLTLTSPSGVVYSRTARPGGATGAFGPTWDRLDVPNPEAGVWTVSMFGADVDPQGEQALLNVVPVEKPNKAPAGGFDMTLSNGTLTLDGSAAKDSDGTIKDHEWYVEYADGTGVRATGKKATVTVTPGAGFTVTQVVRDDDASTAFTTKTVAGARVDVKPFLADNTIHAKAPGVTPIAIISTAELDATKIDLSSLRVGPAAARSYVAVQVDLNADRKPDLLIYPDTSAMGLKPGDTSLTVTGRTKAGAWFTGADRVRVLK
ncbi:GDSL-type esterase/lipase family protein [Catenuloplanes indicus]|uniref:SGNH hydrolase-type esterase domain-containing protein n=1 Tax=Catenuloplanes indicus TaxID=137267 RepID=A0AAE3VUN4_9ACTN|nr:GDSL-type esterase/lipase family protein [Catenuloplanes indicus]MDQ0364146.1 hypothetical protein [Catenuloplanes indicus]